MPKPAAAKKNKTTPSGVIRIRGARQNNLKGIDLDLPLGKLNVITGPSGSGKSSLAFDTIYAEGQRRYVETFSPYVRQFFERMDKPKVDAIHGIPPAIAIEQVNNMRSTRSTVGTITEINDYLKMIFPRLAEASCPDCCQPVRPETAESIQRELLAHHAGKTALIGFGVPVPPNTKAEDFFPFLQSQGFLRVLLFGEVMRTDEPQALKGKKLPAVVTVIQDRVTLESDASRRVARDGQASGLPHLPRLAEAVEAALRLGKGQMCASFEQAGSLLHFSTDWRCANCDIRIPAPTPGLFSFNNPIGACPKCRGFGRTLGLDLRKAIPDESLSIREGLVRAFSGSTYRESQLDLVKAARKKGIDLDLPFEEFSEADRRWLIEGADKDPERAWRRGEWYGVRGFFKWLESKAYKMHVRVFLSRFRAYTTCDECNGGRLKKEAFNFRIAGRTLADLWKMPVSDLLPLVESWPVGDADHAAELLRNEVCSRLSYMLRAGLGYLNLDRQTRTLSGGELQRVNLTTCLGASLVNTLFVLDEPSIGLHPRDIGRLIGVMEGLRDKGNTLLVVEHEEAVMRAADHLIEIGPGRGEKGGEVVHCGPLGALEQNRRSLTGDYLSGRKSIPVPEKRRVVQASRLHSRKGQAGSLSHLCIRGARQNNLKNLDVDIPLGVFCCLTGVSGSGKSTLMHEVLFRNLERMRGAVLEDEPGLVREITGFERFDQVVMVDQTPLARTPRSTPAVFVGAFDIIRMLFADSDEGRSAGIGPGFFSFNSGEGRCERCSGNGYEKIEMQFLSDVYVTCPECEGKRYQPHALRIKFDGKSIYDVLCMTIDEAVAWLRLLGQKRADAAASSLDLLNEAGLGYLRLGQPLNTLSGGEAQRLKLVGHLIEGRSSAGVSSVKSSGGDRAESPQDKAGRMPALRSLLLLDEPTTGLHFDDIALLIKLLQRLVNEGHSLLVIEHNIEVIKCADWIIDLGPEAGAEGGRLVVAGTPEDVARCSESHTGRYLASVHGSRFTVTGSRFPASGLHEANGWARLRDEGLLAAEAPGKYEAWHGKRTGNWELGTGNREPKAANSISIRGAREHNLKNINVEIPRDEFVVITGLSGSGKSSLAFDLVFAEGQRRFLDSMSVYARTFVEQMEKPDVDLISGVPPTVAIEQRVSRGGGKSTVATVTEVYHFLRLLFAKLGTQHCPQCGIPVKKQSVNAVVKAVAEKARGGMIHILAPLIKARKGFHDEVAANARRQGVETLLVDGEFRDTLNFKRLARFKEHTIDAVIARTERNMSEETLRPLVERALKMGKGVLKLRFADKSIQVLNTEMSCPSCALSFEELDPRLFSFNSPHGWCPECRGFGVTMEARGLRDRDADQSLLEVELAEERRFTSDDEEAVRVTCGACGGSRLNRIARAVRLQGLTIQDVAALSAERAAEVAAKLKFEGHESIISRDIMVEIEQRLRFMKEVGLGYLQLNRSADTLSGGEAQRIRLAAQLGSNLRGVLYILDEPTIGLHPRDNARLLNTLTALRDKGNSLLVVEHDDDTMKRADTIIDLGPGAGKFGGEVVAQGTLKEILRNKRSMTAQGLARPMKHPLRGVRRLLSNAGVPPVMSGGRAARRLAGRVGSSSHTQAGSPCYEAGWLRISDARANNLRNVDVQIPLGRLTVITGVSGSGKSSLMHSVIMPAVSAALGKGQKAKGDDRLWKSISGTERIAAVYEVDQSPIGKTSRSCPATYVGVWDDIRKLFAQVPASRTRGYDAGRFSFNTEGGRCDTCSGNGEIKVEMNFLPTTRVHCEVCGGQRFNSATLEIEYGGKNIGEVLKMSIREAAEFFAALPRIARPLQLLADTGLGYLQLGQPSPTLSGGEAQRLKLVTELSAGQGKTATERMRGLKTDKRNLYLIEEPTIGLHHADVARLLDILHRLVDEGHTVVVIEHHPDVFNEADYLIDMGPEAGEHGGRIVACGTPEEVAKCNESRTGPFLVG